MISRHRLTRWAFGLAAAVFCAAGVGARAQAGDGPPPVQSSPPAAGDRVTVAPDPETSCRQGPNSFWVGTADRRSACFWFDRSDVGGAGPFAFVQVSSSGERLSGDSGPAAAGEDHADRVAQLDSWSRVLHAPVVILGRRVDPASAEHIDRDAGTKTEVTLTSAALDQLKARLGVQGFHLAGVGATGNLVATLAIRRTDIGCAVVGGAWLSERDRLAETGELFAPAKLRATNDPLAEIGWFRLHAGFRMIALIDPADPNTPGSALSAFADAASGHDLHFRRVALPALASTSMRAQMTIRAAIACASGVPDQQIEAALRTPIEAAQTPPPAPTLKPIGELILPQVTPQIASLAPEPPRDSPTTAPGPIALPAVPAPIEPQRPAPIAPQAAAPLPVAPTPEPVTFSRAELISGKSIDEPSCDAMPFAVWVTSVGTPECIRYYYSDAGGVSTRALVFLNGDFTYRGLDGQPTVDPDYAHLGPADLQHVADVRSRDYGGPMIYLARPGTLGSSGYELLIRHSPREVALVAAALSEIKRRHGIATFDLIGHSGGGLLVGALVAERSDIGCAVSSSGVLATNAWTSQRLNIPQTNSGFLYDPLEHVNEIHPGPGFRYILLTDAADTTVSASSTQIYLDALAAAGIPHSHMELTAADEAHHDLALHGFRAAIACAHGMTDAEIKALLTKTIVTNRRMSELSPLGDMPEEPVGDKGAPAPATTLKTR